MCRLADKRLGQLMAGSVERGDSQEREENP